MARSDDGGELEEFDRAPKGKVVTDCRLRTTGADRDASWESSEIIHLRSMSKPSIPKSFIHTRPIIYHLLSIGFFFVDSTNSGGLYSVLIVILHSSYACSALRSNTNILPPHRPTWPLHIEYGDGEPHRPNLPLIRCGQLLHASNPHSKQSHPNNCRPIDHL